MRRLPALALAAFAASASASTFVAATVEEVARSSEAVLRGRVVATAARATPRGSIVTDVDVEVASAWKGAPERTVRIVVPGGSLGGMGVRVEGAPIFAAGEDVVVFVVRAGRTWRVNGYGQGKYRVEGGDAHPALGGAEIVGRAVRKGERLVGAMSVDELERRVRAAR
jgi:hypothetical protein